MYLRRKFVFLIRNVSSLRLNSAKVPELTISEGSAFQLCTTLWLNKCFLTSRALVVLHIFLSLSTCPLVLPFPHNCKNFPGLIGLSLLQFWKPAWDHIKPFFLPAAASLGWAAAPCKKGYEGLTLVLSLFFGPFLRFQHPLRSKVTELNLSNLCEASLNPCTE